MPRLPCSLFLFAALLLVVGCSHAPKFNPAKLSNANVNVQHEYVASDRRYRLRLPLAWQTARYAVHERTNAELLQLHWAAREWMVCDFIPFERSGKSEPLFGIVTFKTSDWLGLSATERAQFDQVIAQTSDFVFVALLAPATPYVPGSDNANLYNLMRQSLDQIRAAFVLPNGRTALDNHFGNAAGSYEGFAPPLAGAGQRFRKFSMLLRADGSALIKEMVSGQKLERWQAARWLQKEDVVFLQGLTPTGKVQGMPMLWTVRAGKLTPLAWDKDLYGYAGLLMNSTKPVQAAGLVKH